MNEGTYRAAVTNQRLAGADGTAKQPRQGLMAWESPSSNAKQRPGKLGAEKMQEESFR
jgi:hypothetical protein